MPKRKARGSVPKSLLADLSHVKQRIAALEKNVSNMGKEIKTSSRGFSVALNRYQSQIQSSKASLGKMKAANMGKRRLSTPAVKAWKNKQGGMPIPPPEEDETTYEPAE